MHQRQVGVQYYRPEASGIHQPIATKQMLSASNVLLTPETVSPPPLISLNSIFFTTFFLARSIFYSYITHSYCLFFFLSFPLSPVYRLPFQQNSSASFCTLSSSLLQTVAFNGEVEKVTVEISGACISLASYSLQIGFHLPSIHTNA